ncbi:unnamed protein product, partial [Meganyctiphanes norvegica]
MASLASNSLNRRLKRWRIFICTYCINNLKIYSQGSILSKLRRSIKTQLIKKKNLLIKHKQMIIDRSIYSGRCRESEYSMYLKIKNNTLVLLKSGHPCCPSLITYFKRFYLRFISPSRQCDAIKKKSGFRVIPYFEAGKTSSDPKEFPGSHMIQLCSLIGRFLAEKALRLNSIGAVCNFNLLNYAKGFTHRNLCCPALYFKSAPLFRNTFLFTRNCYFNNIKLYAVGAKPVMRQNRHKMAVKIIQDVYGWAKSLPEDLVDQRIIRMCQGIWTKLRHEYALNRCNRRILSSRAV